MEVVGAGVARACETKERGAKAWLRCAPRRLLMDGTCGVLAGLGGEGKCTHQQHDDDANDAHDLIVQSHRRR